MTSYSPKDYWAGLAEDFRSADPSGFAPVLHPGAPPWFNLLIDKLQYQSWRRAVALARIPIGSRVLDVGCGTGRWVRRFARFGFRPTGVDATPGMLIAARERDAVAPLVAGEARRLPFPDGAFDCITDVTVVQHIPSEFQSEALGEMMRVLKPGGCLILMELIRGNGTHIFPRSPDSWIEQATLKGATLIAWFGQEFLFPDRLFVVLAQGLRGNKGGDLGRNVAPPNSETHTEPLLRSAYWRIRHITAPISAWIDPLTEKICPGKLATHGVFVFRK
ncbi:MAG: class I SAM-dependent methyltransferase [Candidatus Acidiferrales bacterium]